jgi:His-Xaa-Ser system protein HxsD
MSYSPPVPRRLTQSFAFSMPRPNIEPLAETCSIEVDPSIHPREAVLRASYWLSHEAEIDIVTTDQGRFQLTLRPRIGQSASNLVEKLRSALIDFSVRVDIESRTAELRKQIWQAAFSEAMGGQSR